MALASLVEHSPAKKVRADHLVFFIEQDIHFFLLGVHGGLVSGADRMDGNESLGIRFFAY
jgi:hypothetical protein